MDIISEVIPLYIGGTIIGVLLFILGYYIAGKIK